MLKWLKVKLAAMYAHWQGEAFSFGYRWAAGALLSGEHSRISIIDHVDVFTADPYHKGVLAALNDFNKLLDEEPLPTQEGVWIMTPPKWGGA
jgi:hypothetical protein